MQRPSPHYRCFAALALSTALLLIGCAGNDGVRTSAPPPGTARIWPLLQPADPIRTNAVLMRAISLVGTPYRYGGDSPEGGFDCSGLVTYVYRDVLDVRLPRTSRELAWMQGPRIATAQLTGGDLVFFGNGQQVSHVGIYVGEGRFVHAPNAGGTVRLDRLDGSWWRDHYSGARRLLN